MSEGTKIRGEAYKRSEILLIDDSHSRIWKMSFLTEKNREPRVRVGEETAVISVMQRE